MSDPDMTPDENRTHAQNLLALEALVAANRDSKQTMLNLVESVRDETRARDRKVEALEKNNRQTRLLLYMVGGAVFILVLLATFNAVQIWNARQNSQTTARIAANVDQTNRTLLDCMNAQGTCGRVNAAQQARILNEVKKYNLVGFYCIRTNPAASDPKGEEFLKCMARLYPGGPTLPGK